MRGTEYRRKPRGNATTNWTGVFDLESFLLTAVAVFSAPVAGTEAEVEGEPVNASSAVVARVRRTLVHVCNTPDTMRELFPNSPVADPLNRGTICPNRFFCPTDRYRSRRQAFKGTPKVQTAHKLGCQVRQPMHRNASSKRLQKVQPDPTTACENSWWWDQFSRHKNRISLSHMASTTGWTTESMSLNRSTCLTLAVQGSDAMPRISTVLSKVPAKTRVGVCD